MLKAILAFISVIKTILGIVDRKSNQADGAALQRGQDATDELERITDANDAANSVKREPASVQQQSIETDPANRNRIKK